MHFSCELIQCHFLVPKTLFPLLLMQICIEIDGRHTSVRLALAFFCVADDVWTCCLGLHGGNSVCIIFRYGFHFRLILVLIRFSIGIRFEPLSHHLHAFFNMFVQSFSIIIEHYVSDQPPHRILVVVRSVIRTLTSEMVF